MIPIAQTVKFLFHICLCVVTIKLSKSPYFKELARKVFKICFVVLVIVSMVEGIILGIKWYIFLVDRYIVPVAENSNLIPVQIDGESWSKLDANEKLDILFDIIKKPKRKRSLGEKHKFKVALRKINETDDMAIVAYLFKKIPQEKDKDKRVIMIYVLSNKSTKEEKSDVVDLVQSVINENQDSYVTTHAAGVLGSIYTEKSYQVLEELIRNNTEKSVINAAMVAITMHKNKKAIPILEEICKNDDLRLVITARKCINELKNTKNFQLNSN